MVQGQTSLFDEWELQGEPAGVLESLKTVEWSYSKRTILEQCPRRYYYEYYGSHMRKAKDDPRKESLRTLKTLQNRYERTGHILHFVIATYFRKALQGDCWEPDRLSRWAHDMFYADMEYSQADPT